MMKKTLAAFLLGVGTFSLSCGEQAATSDLSWGHLEKMDAKHPFYLINKKPGEVYRVCMAQYMVDEIPGIQEELKAAVNIWGVYLGRTIPVEIEVKDLRRPTSSDTNPSVLAEEYYAACKLNQVPAKKWDLVVGLTPLGDSTVGQTGYWYTTSGGVVRDFRRYLYLRDFKTAPQTGFGASKRWSSLEEVNQKPMNSDEVVGIMKGRNLTKLASSGTSIAFPVLVHEVGHIWGLCDQYTGVNNCDSTWKSDHPDTKSIMAAAGREAKIFLTDDDITGIRQLATRPEFVGTWPDTDDDIQRDPKDM